MWIIDDRLYLLGTSHVAEESLRETKQAFAEILPEVVAVELDDRMIALVRQAAPPEENLQELKGVLSTRGGQTLMAGSVLGGLWSLLAGRPKENEGQCIIRLADEHGVEVVGVDASLESLAKAVGEGIPHRELFQYALESTWQLVKYAVGFRKGPGMFDLRRVPDEQKIENELRRFRRRYPAMAEVLLDQRNRHFAGRMDGLLAEHPDGRILAPLGAAHVPGVVMILRGKGHRCQKTAEATGCESAETAPS